jgi:hypothetical protein
MFLAQTVMRLYNFSIIGGRFVGGGFGLGGFCPVLIKNPNFILETK